MHLSFLLWALLFLPEGAAGASDEVILADPRPIFVFAPNANCQAAGVWGFPSFVDVKSCDLLFGPGVVRRREDPAAVAAFRNARKVYDYYLSVHGWDSYDGKGSPLISVVHAGEKLNFAGWYPKSKFIAYGDGDQVQTRSFAYGMDVAAHEMTHGVTGSTSGLIAEGDPGAINEAVADYFGVVISGNITWNLGCDIFREPEHCKARRCLAHPNDCDTWGAAHLSQKRISAPPCTPDNDFCYMHVNSTIFSHGLYLLDRTLGRKKTERIVFAAATRFMTPTTGLLEAKEAMVNACRSLFEIDTCIDVHEAFRQVGL